MRKLFAISSLLLILLVASAALADSSAVPLAPTGATLGVAAPDITVYDLKGHPTTLSSLRGKVVFLNFWATWCPPCREEMPSIDRLYEVFGDNPDFVMLAVNGEERGKETVPAFLKKNPHSFPVYLDPDGAAQHAYDVTGYPETYIIDKNGILVGKVLGGNDWSSVKVLKAISTLLEK
ncbi:MAG TPA: TlpA disulfide reductase family protein [Desulfuromonadales bacterium]|nr:TlpA disulfide reductase family protein [Desulfuromonadales bacterium]